MTERLHSRVLVEADEGLASIPITSGRLGRKIGTARSTFYIIEAALERPTAPLDTDRACFELFLSYFAHQLAQHHELDRTGDFAHIQATVSHDYANEQGLTQDQAWQIRERADEVDNPIYRHFAGGFVDERFQDAETWPNPIVDLSNDSVRLG
jgi:hypothetical protein